MNLRLITALLLLVALVSVSACGGNGGGVQLPGLDLGQQISGLVQKATGMLGGVTSLDGALAALPGLQGIDSQLGGLVGQVASLSPEGQRNVASAVGEVLPAFANEAERVGEIRGVPASEVDDTLDSMLGKLRGLI